MGPSFCESDKAAQDSTRRNYIGDCRCWQNRSFPVLGGKGAKLAAMNHIGIPVSIGFAVTAEVRGDIHD